MTYQVVTMSNGDVAQWNQFVAECDNASFFHRAEWADVLKRAFGHKPHYLMAKKDGEIHAVLPLAENKSALFGHSLVSTPFCVYGGPAYKDNDALEFILDEAEKLADSLGVEYLEMRTPTAVRDSWLTKDLYVTFGMPISADRDENMTAIWRKQRTVIRKSHKQGLDHTFDENINDFFEVYSTSVRNLGTPVFAKKYFQILKDVFKDETEILTVRKDGAPVSSVLSFYADGKVYPYYGGGMPEARDLKSNDYMYYELMCHAAADRDIGFFDFGRSKKETGAYIYKKHWQMEPQELQYQYYLVKAKELPNLSPNNPKYKLMINVWTRLPLKVSQILGPFLSKYLG